MSQLVLAGFENTENKDDKSIFEKHERDGP